MRIPRFLPVFLLLALAACERGPAPRQEDAPIGEGVSPTRGERFELAWQGVLPCADCAGIQTRLVLRRDGAARDYELEETYLGVDGDNVFAENGDWREESRDFPDGAATVYQLDPAGGGRGFRLLPGGALELLDRQGQPIDSSLDYRLQRL